MLFSAMARIIQPKTGPVLHSLGDGGAAISFALFGVFSGSTRTNPYESGRNTTPPSAYFVDFQTLPSVRL